MKTKNSSSGFAFVITVLGAALVSLLSVAAYSIYTQGHQEADQQKVGTAIAKPVASFETSLASRITDTATTMTLVSTTTADGTSLVAGTLYGFTIDDGYPTLEYVLGYMSTTTANQIVYMTRGISTVTGTTTVAALQFNHSRGASVKISNAPVLLQLAHILDGSDTLPSTLHYTTARSGISSDLTALADVNYVNGVAIAGANDASLTVKGIVEGATGAEAAAGAADGSGNTTAPLALTASIATSTCQTTGGHVLVASTTTGKLDKGCFDQTANYSLSGTHLFTASTTVTATTSISASSVTNNALILNGAATQWPFSNSTGVLNNNGSGVLTWGGTARYVYATTTDIVALATNATSTAFTIPAGLLSASSTITVSGGFKSADTGSDGACVLDLRTSTGTVLVTNAVYEPTTSAVLWTNFAMTVMFPSALTSQKTLSTLNTASDSGGLARLRTAEGSSSIDFSGAQSLVLVVSSSASGAECTLTNEIITVNP